MRRVGPAAALAGVVFLVPLSEASAWQKPEPVVRERVAYEHVAVMDGRGNAIVTWGAEVRGKTALRAAVRPRRGRFGRPQTLSSRLYGQPQLVATPGGESVVLVREPTRLRYAIRPPGGRFGPPVTLVEGPALPRFDLDEQLAVSPRGEVFVSWRQLETATGVTGLRVTVRPPGGAFSPSQTLSDPARGVGAWGLAFAPGGAALVAWTETSAEGTRLAISRRPVGGSFEAAAPLEEANPSPFDDSAVRAALADDGAAVVTWSEDVEVCRSCRAALASAPPGAGLGPPASPSIAPMTSFPEHQLPAAAQADPGGGGAVAFLQAPDCMYCFQSRLHLVTVGPEGGLTGSRVLNPGAPRAVTTTVAHSDGALSLLWAEPSADRFEQPPGPMRMATRMPKGSLPAAAPLAPGRAFSIDAVPWGSGPTALALWESLGRRDRTGLRARLLRPGGRARIETVAPRPRRADIGATSLGASGSRAVAAWQLLDPDDNDPLGIDAAVR